jgi:hypothetical protein
VNVLAVELDEVTRLQVAWCIRDGARDIRRSGIDVSTLLAFGEFIDPRPVMPPDDPHDDPFAAILRQRESWRLASARYRARKRSARLAASA